MPKTELAKPSSKLSCPSSDELRQYLAGWMEEAQAADIDAHLQSCELCDLTLKELESHPETLLQSLQSTVGHLEERNDSAEQVQTDDENSVASQEENSSIGRAFQNSKKLIDVTTDALDDAAKPRWQPTIKELGIYDLIRPLGRGGMGAVYLALHRQLRKQVAIKLLPLVSGEDSDVRARFEREIRVVGRLNHPSIVAATDAGEIDGTQFLVMEYVPGLDLSRLARLLGRLSVADSCELIRQVALGLSCAHAEGVVHRDVKPSNLMLDESGRIRILDFGLAQLSVWDEASVDLTTVGQLMGTLDYMAPEQAELSGNVDYRADLYALGATLFRLLCGRPPLAAAPNQSPLEKLRLLANHQPPKLGTLCPEAPPELVKLVSSMLARNPQDRPVSAAHVAEQLGPMTTGSKLVELLERAKKKAATSPEQSKKSLLGVFPTLLAPAPASTASSALVLKPDDGNHGRGKTVRRFLLAASLPLMLLAGLIIKLELDKGQLVIESDVDNVRVSVLRNKNRVEGIQISHGATSTRLQADDYEITIDGPSSGLMIDKNEFTLKDGETVIARIRQAPAPGKIPEAHSSVADAQRLGPLANSDPPTSPEVSLYDGKPLDQWLEILSREKSAQGLKTAFEACAALAEEENGERIANVVLKVVPKLPGEMNLEADPAKGSRFVDRAAQQLLQATLPGQRFWSRWVVEFDAGDAAWRKRLWESYSPTSPELTVDDVEPFVAWAENRLRENRSGRLDADQDSLRAAVALRNMIPISSQLSTETFRNRVIGILTSSPQLPISWWLSQPLIFRSGETDREIWPTEFKTEVTRRAIEAMQNAETSPSLVVQASIILANGTGQSPEQQQLISAAIGQRLATLAKDKSSLTQVVQTAEEFTNFSVPALDTQSPLYLTPIQIEVRRSWVREIPVIENSVALTLLNHAWKLDKGMSDKSQLDQIFGAAHGTFERIHPQMPTTSTAEEGGTSRSRGFRGQISLLWPDLEVSEGNSQAFAPRGPANMKQISMSMLWGKYEPTKQDWLEYLILLHPAMTERVTEAVKASTPTPAAETAPAEKPE